MTTIHEQSASQPVTMGLTSLRKKSLLARSMACFVLLGACDAADADKNDDTLFADADSIDPEVAPAPGKADGGFTVRGHLDRLVSGHAFALFDSHTGTTYSASDSRVGGTPFAVRQAAIRVEKCVPPNSFDCNTNDPGILEAAEQLDCGLGGVSDTLAPDTILSFYAPALVQALRNDESLNLGAKSSGDTNIRSGMKYRAYTDGWIDMCRGHFWPDLNRIFVYR